MSSDVFIIRFLLMSNEPNNETGSEDKKKSYVQRDYFSV